MPKFSAGDRGSLPVDRPARRSFLGALLAVGGAGMAALLSAPLIRFAFYPLRNSTNETGWSEIGPATDFAAVTTPVTRIITVEQLDGWRKIVAQRPVYVIKDASGTLSVLSPVCPHLGCTVRLAEDESNFVCPCHNGAFSAS